MLIKNRYIFITLILSSAVAVAADLNPSAGPADTLSYTLQDICNRLGSGEEGTQRNFTEPTSGPAANANSTDCTLNKVMEKAPAVTEEAAEPDDVRMGKKYWGLTDGDNWGIKTGSSTAVDTSSGDATANDIKEGKIAWVDGKEVVGTSTAVDTKSGDATANEIKEGRIAWVDGEEVVGTLEEGVDCSTDTDRFTDNNDGTVTDTCTKLIWLKNANCYGAKNWNGAKASANSASANSLNDYWATYFGGNVGICGLSDGSSAGDWRLPSLDELQSLIDYSQYEPALPSGHPFSGVQLSYYWSTSTAAYRTGRAWYVSLIGGGVGTLVKTDTYYVWPVRSRH